MLETVIIEPKNTATHSIIWLHGLGADGHDFVPIVPELQPASADIRFIFPHAPVRPVGLFGGSPARAWFDLFADRSGFGFNEEEVVAMSQLIDRLIRKEIEQGINASRILLAGFSQGGAMAAYTALTTTHQLGGLIGLSTFLPPAPELAARASTRFPVFIGHGTADDVVPYAGGLALSNALTVARFPVSWHSYPITHTVSQQETQDIRQWLMTQFYGARPL